MLTHALWWLLYNRRSMTVVFDGRSRTVTLWRSFCQGCSVTVVLWWSLSDSCSVTVCLLHPLRVYVVSVILPCLCLPLVYTQLCVLPPMYASSCVYLSAYLFHQYFSLSISFSFPFNVFFSQCCSLSMFFSLNVFPSQYFPLLMFSPLNISSLCPPFLMSLPLKCLLSWCFSFPIFSLNVLPSQFLPSSKNTSPNILLSQCFPLSMSSFLKVFFSQ